jgi:hypothetical protein
MECGNFPDNKTRLTETTMTTITQPAAFVQMAEDTEEQIISVCRELVAKIDDYKWDIGRLAHQWTTRFAKGRTDEDFGKLIGLPQQQVNQRRLVWATFGDVYHSSGKLTWTHFREVLNWDDAEEWLAEANSNGWSVANMKRMRDVRQRIADGDDLTEPNEHFGDPEELPTCKDDLQVHDVQDVDPHQKPPSITKSTPRDFDDEAAPQPLKSQPVGPVPTGQPVTTNSVTIDNAINNIAALVTALKPQLKGNNGHTLAAQLRRWADEIDPPKTKQADTSTLPARLDTTEGRQAMDEWREYRRQTKKKLTPMGERKLMAEWAERGCARFVAAVNHSIANGWQGLFEPEGKHGNASNARAISEGRAVGDNYQPAGGF